MERLANRVANRISMELAYPEEQRQVIAYGLTAIFQTVFMTAIVLALGAVLHIFVESAILCFAVSILRKYSGGTHASSIGSCTIIGVVFCIGFGIALKALGVIAVSPVVLILASILTFGYAFFVAIKKAPVDSPNKPIRTEKKRKKMRLGDHYRNFHLHGYICGSYFQCWSFFDFRRLSLLPVAFSNLADEFADKSRKDRFGETGSFGI